MPDKALEALKVALRRHIDWLHDQADNQRSEEAKQDFHHQANNLDALMVAYERLTTKVSGGAMPGPDPSRASPHT